MQTEAEGQSDLIGATADRGRGRSLAEKVLAIAIVLVVWEVSARTIVDPFWVSMPSAIVVRLWRLVVSGDLLWHAEATILQALLGAFAGLVAGVLAGVLLVRFSRVAAALNPMIVGFYSLPRIALAPLFIIWFGIGLLSKVMMVFSFVVFIFLMNTMQGLKAIDPDHIDLMRSMRASPVFIARKVKLPAILPWLINGARISIGLALIGSVLGELLGASRGLGWYVENAGGRLDTTGVFSGIISLMIVAILMNAAVDLVERRLTRG